jgi:hypothetical protein
VRQSSLKKNSQLVQYQDYRQLVNYSVCLYSLLGGYGMHLCLHVLLCDASCVFGINNVGVWLL